jgi:hypothetical protein
MSERKPVTRPARARVAPLSTGATASAVVLPAQHAPRPDAGELEGSIMDLAYMADLVREDTVNASPGPGDTAVVSGAVHWGLLQVLNRVCDLQEEFYALLHGSPADE